MVSALGSLEGYKLDACFRQLHDDLPYLAVRSRDMAAGVARYGRLRRLWMARRSSLVAFLCPSQCKEVSYRWARAGWFRGGRGMLPKGLSCTLNYYDALLLHVPYVTRNLLGMTVIFLLHSALEGSQGFASTKKTGSKACCTKAYSQPG